MKKNVSFFFSVVINCCVVLLVEKGGDAFDGLTFKLMLTLNITRTIFFFDDFFCQQSNIFWGVFQHMFNSGKLLMKGNMMLFFIALFNDMNFDQYLHSACILDIY